MRAGRITGTVCREGKDLVDKRWGVGLPRSRHRLLLLSKRKAEEGRGKQWELVKHLFCLCFLSEIGNEIFSLW